MRAHLAEFGIVAGVGRNRVERLLNVIDDEDDERMPPIEVPLTIAAHARVAAVAALRPERLHRRPGLDQRTVLPRNASGSTGRGPSGGQRRPQAASPKPPPSAGGPGSCRTRWRPTPHRTWPNPRTREQQIEVQLLHQLVLQADRVESLQQQGSNQLLQWDRRAPGMGIEVLEIPRQRSQDLVHDPTDHPKRMVARGTRLSRSA